MSVSDPQLLLRRMLDAAISAADPAKVLAQHLPEKPTRRCIVVGAGKAAASMARAVEVAWPDVDLSGVVVTRYGHATATDRIIVREASHPVPDEAGLSAAREILEAAQQAREGDLVLALISGGGSALMPMPRPPLTIDDEVAVNKALLRSGLTIDDMNRVRRRLSLIKGGGLAEAAHPAKIVTLAISDVPGDNPAAIASGPTVPDPTAGEDLSAIVERLGQTIPAAARRILLAEPAPAPAPNFDADFRLIAVPQMALEAAAQVARDADISPVLLGDALEGEARELGTVMAGIAKAIRTHGTPSKAPAILISGGETTVTIGSERPGKGGRNTEFLLGLALGLSTHPDIHAIAADTDGIDGNEDAAGAILGPDSLAMARDAGLDPEGCLTSHDSYTFFRQLDALIHTGPTLTNVNDFRAVLIC